MEKVQCVLNEVFSKIWSVFFLFIFKRTVFMSGKPKPRNQTFSPQTRINRLTNTLETSPTEKSTAKAQKCIQTATHTLGHG